MMGFGTMGFGMILIWLIPIAAVIIGVALLKRTPGSEMNLPGPRRPTALEILEERYARGEINQREFETMKRDLTRS
jgi:putative membrane protein